jgi:MFS superfamily sulfate permease-like transporter
MLGLMFNVAFSTFEWKESKELFIQSRKSLKGFFNLLGMLVTFGLCYKVDMGIGIIAGIYMYINLYIRCKYVYI